VNVKMVKGGDVGDDGSDEARGTRTRWSTAVAAAAAAASKQDGRSCLCAKVLRRVVWMPDKDRDWLSRGQGESAATCRLDLFHMAYSKLDVSQNRLGLYAERPPRNIKQVGNYSLLERERERADADSCSR
jgi:hypothetical protein